VTLLHRETEAIATRVAVEEILPPSNPTQTTFSTVELLLVVVGIETTNGAEIVATETDTTI
jgi:hypothetical protein